MVPMRHIAATIALLLSLPRVLAAQADTVRGVVYDSLAAAPLAGAFVTAEGGTASAVTDSLGRFTLMADARIASVVVYHDVLDRLGLGALLARRAGERAWAPRVATPSSETVWQRLCGTRRPSNGLGGIVIGSTRFADDTTRVGGARVVIEWESLRLMAAARRDSVRYESVTARSDSIGEFVACGVQEFGQAGAMASAAEFKSGSVLLLADVRPLRRVDLVLAAASTRAVVSGVVRDENGQAVASATITLDGVDDAMVTDGAGRFTFAAVPSGTRMLSVRKVGYLPTVQSVEVLARGVRDLPLIVERGVTLDGVKVTARATLSRDRQEFEERRRAGVSQVMDSTRLAQFPLLQSALRMYPSLVVQSGRSGVEFALLGRITKALVRCRVYVWVDGMREDEDYLRRLPLENIAAMELFNTDALAPARFRTFGDTCNTLLVWTKGYLRG